MRPILMCGTAALLLMAGCSGKRDPSELLKPTGAGTIVVDARLIVGNRLPAINLSTTQAPDRPFDRSEAAIAEANVIVVTATGDTIPYFEPGTSGRYLPVEPHIVEPATTYFLRVIAPDGRVVTAQTTTPKAFSVDQWVLVDSNTGRELRRLAAPRDFTDRQDSVFIVDSNQLIYQEGLVEARFRRGTELAFQMALINIDLDPPLLVTGDFLDEDVVFEQEVSSPPFDAPDGFIRLPWLAVYYGGATRFLVYSVDRNWYDVIRTVRFFGPASGGFGGTAGDEFERPVFHIEGGIGLFGSAAMDETGFTVHPRP